MKAIVLLVLTLSLFGNLYLYHWLAFNVGLMEKTGLFLGGFWSLVLLSLLFWRKKQTPVSMTHYNRKLGR